MQCRLINQSSGDFSEASMNEALYFETTTTKVEELELANAPALHFQTQFEGYMEMYSDGLQVADYLNAHQGWFCRCAQPMQVEPLEENGYILTIGRFGAFGYEVEPKMAVILHPPQNGLYVMESIPLADAHKCLGYEVDYQAKMELVEIPWELAGKGMAETYEKQSSAPIPSMITKVQWELNLNVFVKLPKFIYKLPSSLIQSTGDRLLTQIVRQVSPRLTQKVQQDFHNRFELPIPPKTSRHLAKGNKQSVGQPQPIN